MNINMRRDGTGQQVSPSIVSFFLVDMMHNDVWTQAHSILDNSEKRVIWLNFLHPELHYYAVL